MQTFQCVQESEQALHTCQQSVKVAAKPECNACGVQVLGGIVYGGRLTDAADTCVLMALLRSFVRPELLREGCSFASEAAYRRPDAGSLQSYRSRT